MGNAENHDKPFIRQEWILQETNDRYKQWRSRMDNKLCLEEYSISCSSDDQHNRQQQIYKLRKEHPQIVSSFFLIPDKQNNLCSTTSNIGMFIEKIPIRLSDIEHIPLIDSLHIFSQCFHGYHQLSHHFGFFPVIEQMIGINQMGVVKVWVNQDYSQINTHGRVSEEKMVETIIEAVNNTIDKNDQRNKRPVKSYFYLHSDTLKFEQALTQLSCYANQFFGGVIPARLGCIDKVGGVSSITNFQKKSFVKYQDKTPTAQPSYNRPRLVDSTIIKQQVQVKNNKKASVIIYDQPKKQIVRNREYVNQQRIIIPPTKLYNDTIITRKKGSSFQGLQTNNQNFQAGNIIPAQKLSSSHIFSNSAKAVYQNTKISQFIPVSSHISNYRQIPPANIMTGTLPMQQNRFIIERSTIDKRIPQVIPSRIPQRQLSQSPSLIQLVKEQNLNYNQFNRNKSQVHYSQLPSRHLPLQIKQEKSSYLPQFGSNQYMNNKVDQIVYQRADRYTNNRNMNSQITNSQFINGKNPQNNFIPDEEISLPSRQKINIEEDHTLNNKMINNMSNNTKISQYTTIDIQDGKSSLDFMKKIRQFVSSKKPQPFIQETEYSQNNNEAETLKQQLSQSILGIERACLTRQVTSSRNLIPEDTYQDFGRNAVSNIVSNQSNIYKTSQKDTNRQIFKFQNNLEMKYSIFKADDSVVYERTNNSPIQTFAKYESRLDPELFADLAKIKG